MVNLVNFHISIIQILRKKLTVYLILKKNYEVEGILFPLLSRYSNAKINTNIVLGSEIIIVRGLNNYM